MAVLDQLNQLRLLKVLVLLAHLVELMTHLAVETPTKDRTNSISMPSKAISLVPEMT
jgi:hypothetical protein